MTWGMARSDPVPRKWNPIRGIRMYDVLNTVPNRQAGRADCRVRYQHRCSHHRVPSSEVSIRPGVAGSPVVPHWLPRREVPNHHHPTTPTGSWPQPRIPLPRM